MRLLQNSAEHGIAVKSQVKPLLLPRSTCLISSEELQMNTHQRSIDHTASGVYELHS
jgi:hypothetical protein